MLYDYCLTLECYLSPSIAHSNGDRKKTKQIAPRQRHSYIFYLSSFFVMIVHIFLMFIIIHGVLPQKYELGKYTHIHILDSRSFLFVNIKSNNFFVYIFSQLITLSDIGSGGIYIWRGQVRTWVETA